MINDHHDPTKCDNQINNKYSHSPSAVLASAKAEKKGKYCDECCATFTPLCYLVDGLKVGDEAAFFLKHLARSLYL